MNKALTAERIFSLGNYENLKTTDTITEIPETIAMNPEALTLLRYLQLLDIENTYLRYQELRAKTKVRNAEDFDKALSFLEQERIQTFEDLLNTIYTTEKNKENEGD